MTPNIADRTAELPADFFDSPRALSGREMAAVVAAVGGVEVMVR